MKFNIYILFLFITSVSFGQIRYGSQGRINANDITISAANPQELTIAEIEIEGAEYLDKNALTSISGLKVGDKIKVPGDKLTGAIKKLWKQGLIGDIQIYVTKIEASDVYLKIKLTERPRLSRFEFNGITKAQSSDLKEKIDLIRGRVMTDVITKNAKITIKEYLNEKGYLNAIVETTYEDDSSFHNSVVLNFDITKNRKVKIRDVNFENNTNYSDMKLKSKMKNSGERPRVKVISAALAIGAHAFKGKDDRVPIFDDSIRYNVSKSTIELLSENFNR